MRISKECDLTMNEQEWQACVNHVAGGEYPVPRGMISNYNDWRCRSTVGRALYWMGEVEAAMHVLATILDVEPDMEDAPEMGLSEAEHKVLCLRDIAEIVWKLARNEDAALNYLDQAYALSRAYKHPFRSASRGDMFYRRLAILREVGKEEQAVQEAEKMREREAGNDGINPYRYFAYKFLAEHEHNNGDDEKAAQLFAEAFRYYPVSEAGERDLAKAAAAETAADRYKAYVFCSTIQYKPWEELPPAIIRRDL